MKPLTRRSFLRSSALATASTGLALGSIKLPAQKYRIATAGHPAAFHAPVLAKELVSGRSLAVLRRHNLWLLTLRGKIIGSLPGDFDSSTQVEVDHVAKDPTGRISLFVRVYTSQQFGCS